MAGEPNDRGTEGEQRWRSEILLQTKWRFVGRPVRIKFPTKNVSTEVLHQLGEFPDGYDLVDADCLVKRVAGKQWTKEVAYLMSDTDNSYAVLCFGVLREEVLDVQGS